ncbi:MAG: C39 family peptidase [Gemmatimonadaceae bacterium]|nr:C39 family peptidase [Gemmatimonadaceae bacterium]MCW5825747.1 C39 family peptidase [Gemmatimonadaceae bacterium]
MSDDSVLSAAGRDAFLRVVAEGSVERIRLSQLTLVPVVHELTGYDEVLSIWLESNVERAIGGRFELRMHTRAKISSLVAPWSTATTMRANSEDDASGCRLITEAGTCGNTQWTISPFAPGDPFGDFQSQEGTGISEEITISFSDTVSTATVTVEDPSLAGNQVVAYLGEVEVSRQDFAFSGQGGVNLPDTKTVAGPFDRIVLVPAPLDYVAYSVSIGTPPAEDRCEATVTPYTQGNPLWGSLTYDNTNSTIARKGCALTSLAMALTAAGYAVQPDSLNTFMIANEGYSGSAVYWQSTVPSFSGGSLRWVSLGQTNPRTQLAASVCAGYPVVVRVPSLATSGGFHFVVVTGAPRNATETTSLSEFTIADPAPSLSDGTLEPYGSFQLRGYAVSSAPPTSTLASPAIVASAQPRLILTVVGGTLRVTDPQGRSIGQTTRGGAITNEIPGGLVDDDEAPASQGNEFEVAEAQVSVISIPEPIGGTYRLVFTATSSLATASVRAAIEQADGSFLNSASSLSAVAGTAYSFEVPFDPSSGSAPAVAPSTLAPWSANTYYAAGARVSFNNKDYQARQAHTSLANWQPPNVYALWARINAGEMWAPQVIYPTGAEVLYLGIRYRAIQGHQSLPGWIPPAVPALWTVVN